MSGPRLRVLITGAAGLLGRSLVREYAAAGAEVLAPGRDRLDLLDPVLTISCIECARPHLVVHAAAYTAVDRAEEEPDLAMAVNAGGTRAAAEGARRAAACFVLVSTDYVFDGAKRAPYDEGDEPNPLSAYGRSKLAAEKAVRDVLERFLVVRTSWLFGPGRPNFVSGMARRAAAGERVQVVDDQAGSPSYAPHVARGIRLLHERRAGGTVHVANDGVCTWFDLAGETYRLSGAEPSLVNRTTAAALGRPAPRPPFSALSTKAFTRLTGSPLPPWRDAVGEYFARHDPRGE